MDNVRSLGLVKKARELSSSTYYHLLYPELVKIIQECGLELICVDSNYRLDEGSCVDFSFYCHSQKVVVLIFETVRNNKLEPFWGKDFRLAYNLILVHEIGHYLSYHHNDYSENGAWINGLSLAEYLKIFTPQLTQLLKNYFIE